MKAEAKLLERECLFGVGDHSHEENYWHSSDIRDNQGPTTLSIMRGPQWHDWRYLHFFFLFPNYFLLSNLFSIPNLFALICKTTLVHKEAGEEKERGEKKRTLSEVTAVSWTYRRSLTKTTL